MAATQSTSTVIRDWSGSPLDAKKNLIAANNAIRRGTVTVDPPSIAGGAVGTATAAVTGAAATDFLAVQAPATLNTGLVVVRAWVSAADTISISMLNTTAGPLDAAAAAWEYLLVGNSTLVSQSV